jgi:hypothetical protein
MEDDEWPILCSARPEFTALSAAEVRNAIENDSEGNNPVTKEVLRLGAEFLARFKIYVDQHGFKSRGMNFPVRCPIEKIAIEVLMAFIAAETASVRSRKGH